jgi:hypothetical protein
LEIEIRFYTRKDFGGWRRYMWLPVKWAQGRYVHCEIFSPKHGKVLNADNRRGVVWQEIGKFVFSGVQIINIDDQAFDDCVNVVLGQDYSWSAFFKILWPRWGNDPKGMICSELVAFILSRCASEDRHWAPFCAVPPHRWTPNQIFDALERLKKREDRPT